MEGWWWLVALFSTGAGSIHLALALAHREGPITHHFFFLGVAAFQIGWGALVFPAGLPRRWLTVGVWATAGVLALWAVSRVIGLPPGERFGVERPDLIAAGFEVAMIVLLTRGRPGVDPPRWVGVITAVLVFVLIVVGGLAALEGEGHFDTTGVHVH